MAEAEAGIVSSPYPDIKLPAGLTFTEFVLNNAKIQGHAWGNRTAFECGLTGRRYTHNEVYSTATSFAAALVNVNVNVKELQLQFGDVVAVCLPNMPEYASVLFGIWQAGLVASPMNPAYKQEEMGRQLADAGAKAVVTTPELVGLLQAAFHSQGLTFIVIGDASPGTPGCLSWHEMVKTHGKPGTQAMELLQERRRAIDTLTTPCLLPYSSGTTGTAKGVMITHSNLIAIALQLQAAMPKVSDAQQERFIGLLPMFHVAGLASYIVAGILAGAHILTLSRFNPADFLAAVRAHKPTMLHLVPPLAAHIVNCAEIGAEELRALRTVIVGAAPLDGSMAQKFVDKTRDHGRQDTDLVFQQIYGMTEAAVTHLLPPGTHAAKPGSVGCPVSGTLTKIVDVTHGTTVTSHGPQSKGEICVQGPQVMLGYYRNPVATQATVDSDGWLHTGDIGYYDEDGFLVIVERLKELIKVKGFQVAPSELEAVLREHEDIADVAVIGVPHELSGEAPFAVIVRASAGAKKDRSRDCELSEEDVHAYLRPRVAGYKQLRGGVVFVDAIPKGPVGKVLRREVFALWNAMRKSDKK